MSDVLKRIEERHKFCGYGGPCRVEDPDQPCDVVKLARALERARATFASCHGYEGAARDCERELEEVAGD